MAFHGVVELPAGTWVHLTSGGGVAAAEVTLLGLYPNDIHIDVRAAASAPSDFTTSLMLNKDKGIIGQTLAALCPGVAGQHIYAYSNVRSKIFVSYA
jgi:hypothetical protein